jgi:hypothetical protein
MLRPAFTQHLAKTLLAGQSVNLVSPHGRGRRQTLIDLISLLDDVQVAKIDLKREQGTWHNWLEKTLRLKGQVIVIIHNIEDATNKQKQVFSVLQGVTLLYVSEQPISNKTLLEIEVPEE